MGTRLERKHVIDFIFPLALFFVLASCSLASVVLAANVYAKSTQQENENFESRTALSYVTQKIHQSDENGAVSVSTFDGRPCVAIKEDYNGVNYTTYIYEEDGALMELFLQDGVNAKASDGSRIMEVRSFEVRNLSETLIEIVCEGSDGLRLSTICAVTSVKGES